MSIILGFREGRITISPPGQQHTSRRQTACCIARSYGGASAPGRGSATAARSSIPCSLSGPLHEVVCDGSHRRIMASRNEPRQLFCGCGSRATLTSIYLQTKNKAIRFAVLTYAPLIMYCVREQISTAVGPSEIFGTCVTQKAWSTTCSTLAVLTNT